jgi:hypothetical protein
LKGLGIDEAVVNVQRRYTIDIWCSNKPIEADVDELDGLLKAWYVIGFHGGFGWSMNHTLPPFHEETAEGWHARYGVVGVVTHQALAVLLRCLDVSDVDLVFERVEVDVTAYD